MPPANWSLGAGVFGNDFGATGTLAPSYGAALERRASTRTWLAVNVLGSFESRDVPLNLSMEAVGGRTQVKVRTGAIALLLGARHVLVRGVVDLSLYSAAFASYQTVGGDRLRTGESPSFYAQRGKTRTIGLVGGLAVERKLLDALAVRLSLELLTASLSSSDTVSLDSIGVEQHTELGARRIALSPKPGLQLYFYF